MAVSYRGSVWNTRLGVAETRCCLTADFNEDDVARVLVLVVLS